MRVRRSVPAFDEWSATYTYDVGQRSKSKSDSGLDLASLIEHRMGFMTVPELNPGGAYGRSYTTSAGKQVVR